MPELTHGATPELSADHGSCAMLEQDEDLSGDAALEQTLRYLVLAAVTAIPGADSAALSLLDQEPPLESVATDNQTSGVTGLQHQLDEGPSVDVVQRALAVRSGNLGGDTRFPRFGPRAGRLGFHSALGLPLVHRGRMLGVASVYSRRREAFDSRSEAAGADFGRKAAFAVASAQRLARAELLVDQLREALTSRSEIDHAVGLIMGRAGLDAAHAFERLRDMSQSRSVKLTQVASELLDQAVGDARARRTRAAHPDRA